MATKSSRKLTEQQKAFVVQSLACFDTPKEVSEALREEMGVQITPQSAEAYDYTKKAGRGVAQKWRDLFDQTRKRFLDDIEGHVPEANRAVRVRQLAHAARAFKGRNNYIGMADMLERIAKELGNVHTNKREVTGKGGGPIEYSDMTDEQLNARLGALFNAVTATTPDEAAKK